MRFCSAPIYLLVAAALPGASAWWCSGHMLVANIALESGIMSAATKAKVTALIEDPSMSTYTLSPDFVSSACWADDLKAMGTAQEAPFHFIDIPVIAPGFTGTPAPVPTAATAPWAINNGQSTVYSTKSQTLDKARQLRFIIHFVGDIHQPLHAAALFSDQFPNGDAGGNLYPVAGVSYTDELHAVWDSGAGQWVDDIVRPLNSTGTEWIGAFTSQILAAYPVSSLQPYIKEYNTSAWANESNDIAATFAYTAPQAPTPLPADYIATAQTTCLKQLAIGGARLADLLEYVFTASPAWADAGEDALAARASRERAQAAAAAEAGAVADRSEALDRPIAAPSRLRARASRN